MSDFNYWISTKKGNYVHHNCEVYTTIKIDNIVYYITLQNGHKFVFNDFNKPSNFFSFYTEYADKKIRDFWNFYESDVERLDVDDLEKYGFKSLSEAITFYHKVQEEINIKIDEADDHIRDLMQKGGDLYKIEELLLDNDFDSEILSNFYGQENDTEKIIEFLEKEAESLCQ